MFVLAKDDYMHFSDLVKGKFVFVSQIHLVKSSAHYFVRLYFFKERACDFSRAEQHSNTTN
jgi:hypothetical protein